MNRFILLVVGALIASAGWGAVVTDEIPGLPGSLSGEGGFLSLPSANTNSEMAMLLMKALKSAPKEARVRDAERVLALDPADRTAQQTLARLYLADNRLDEAAALLWKAARASPADLNSLEEFGFALLASGGHQGGYKIYQELYRVGHRTPAVLFNLAAAQHHLGRYADAQALMKDFLAALARQQREAGQTDLFEKTLRALGQSIGEPAAQALLESKPLPIYLIR